MRLRIRGMDAHVAAIAADPVHGTGFRALRWERRAGQRVLMSAAGAEEAARMSLHIGAIAERRDRAAFEALFRHFAPRVKAYLLRKGASAGAAEELMQETMVAVWRKAALYDPARASAATWVFTIARNLRIDAFRRERRPQIDPNDPALGPEPEPRADAVVESREDAAELSSVLSALSDGERRLVALAYYEDKTQSMIAKELGIPLGTVKSRMRQVLARLRAGVTQLREDGE